MPSCPSVDSATPHSFSRALQNVAVDWTPSSPPLSRTCDPLYICMHKKTWRNKVGYTTASMQNWDRAQESSFPTSITSLHRIKRLTTQLSSGRGELGSLVWRQTRLWPWCFLPHLHIGLGSRCGKANKPCSGREESPDRLKTKGGKTQELRCHWTHRRCEQITLQMLKVGVFFQ